MEYKSDVVLHKYYLQLIFDDDTELSRDQFEDSFASSSTELKEEILLRPTGTFRSYTGIFNEDDVNVIHVLDFLLILSSQCLQFLFESPLSPTSGTLSTTTASSDCLATPSDPIFESTCSPDDIFPSDSYRHLENGDASLDLNLELNSDQFRCYHNVYHDLAPWSHSEKGLQEESSSLKLPAALNYHDDTKTHDELSSSGSPSFSHLAGTISGSLCSPVHWGFHDDWNTTQDVLIPSDPLSPGNHDDKQGVNPALSDNTYPCARSRHRTAKQGISYKGLDTTNGPESDEDYHDGDFGTTIRKRKRRSKQQEQLHSRKKADLTYAFFNSEISEFKNTHDVRTNGRGGRKGRKGKVEEQFPLDKRAKHCGSRVSSSSPRYECELGCGKSFLRRLDRRRHENFSCKLRDSKVPVKEFPCPDCGKTLKRADALQRHIKCVHSDSNGVTGI
ncbi:hypothetical protein FB446DRAFT_733325 [Lentinula raphanica]|nr:hypothetical protein FB446DRAFT_733325 [Lentinula raphanica]